MGIMRVRAFSAWVIEHIMHVEAALQAGQELSMTGSSFSSSISRSATTTAARPIRRVVTGDARFWNRKARAYAASKIADLPGYEQTLARTINYLGPQQDVLEVGCGTGSSALRLAPFCRSYRATDVASEMIAIANGKLARAPDARLQFAVDDATTCDSESANRYDRVLAFNVLHLVEDLEATVEACASALRPGGLLISKTPCLREMNWLLPNVAVPLAQLVGMAPTVHNLSENDLLDSMRHQGLIVVSVERHGTRGQDVRPFIVARKPAAPEAMFV